MIAGLTDTVPSVENPSHLERIIIVWQWDKEKVFKTISVSMHVNLLRAGPTPNLYLTVSGEGNLKSVVVGLDNALKRLLLFVFNFVVVVGVDNLLERLLLLLFFYHLCD